MPTPKPADVDAYLAAQPSEVRAALVKVRAAMRRALPASVEAIKREAYHARRYVPCCNNQCAAKRGAALAQPGRGCRLG